VIRACFCWSEFRFYQGIDYASLLCGGGIMINIIQRALRLCLLLGGSCLFPGLTSSLAADFPDTVKIGVIVPLSGDMALHGTEIRKALELAQKQSGDTHYRYKLYFEDNQLEGSKSVTAARRLIEVEKVDTIVTLWPPTAQVVIPLTEQKGRLHYTIAWDPELARKNKLVLSHQAMLDNIVRATLSLLEDKGIKRPAFLHMEEAGFNLGAAYVQRLAPDFGVELAADEKFSPQETDFHTLLERVEKRKPQAYLIWAVMPSLDLVIRQIRERKPGAFITGYLDYAQDLSRLQGAEYVSEMYASDKFLADYTAAYGSAPISKGANAFDIFNLLVQTYEQYPEQKPSASLMKTGLLKVKDYHGAVGVFSIDHFGNSTYAPVRRKIEGTERTLTKKNYISTIFRKL
jgi:ABC-type branched-subunit amino acid transport system substrate-binding protein